jgi:hypothetical protein
VCGLLLATVPVIGAILPQALAQGLSTVQVKQGPWGYLGIGFVLSTVIWAGLRRGWKREVVSLLAGAAVLAVVYLKVTTFPALDREASARPLWNLIEPDRDQVCLDEVGRQLAYGLNYYSLASLPTCDESPRAIRVTADRKLVR